MEPTIVYPEIVYEDVHLAVIEKPSGLLSQGAHPGEPNLVDYLRVYFGRNYVGLVHRLDRNTSGLMVVAKRSKAANRLTAALQSGELQRTYLAWVKGSLSGAFQWEHLLRKNEKTNEVSVVQVGGRIGGQIARLKGNPLKKARGYTLVEFKLETGRSHQIRVQSSFEGHPLLGDRKYGRKNDEFPRLALHSAQLVFPHPMSDEVMHFQSKLPALLDF